MSYAVGPTTQDITNAYAYAYNKISKEICEAPENKGIYKWVENKIVPYPCPYGLDCVSGRCVYTEEGCKAASTPLPYFDCKRKKVSCFLDTHPDGVCEVCDYGAQDYKVKGPYLPEEYDPIAAKIIGCAPGDQKYLTMNNPAEDAESEAETPTNNYQCQGMVFDPEPYKIDGKTIPCEDDTDCGAAAGGACMLYEYNVDPITGTKLGKKKSYKQCYDTGAGYLEYRKNFVQWEGYPGEDQCVLTTPVFKQWCEMPWIRPGPDGTDDDKSVPMDVRIQKHPQTKVHPPFFYDEYAGKCYVTKDYCTKSVPDGGYSGGFGNQVDYIKGVLEGCSNPGHNKAQVRQGYDCCTPFANSFGAFVVGSTLTTLLSDVFNGEITLSQFMTQAFDLGYPVPPPFNIVLGFATIAGLTALTFWLSEDQLKGHKHIVAYDYITPGINLYQFTWTPEAREKYPDQHFARGPRLGLMASEVQALYPNQVVLNEKGDRMIVMDEDMMTTDRTFHKIVVTVLLFDFLGSSKELSHIRL
jgi:hypothetical protein